MGAALSLAVAEHLGIALSYLRAVSPKLQERARRRLAGAHFYTELLAEFNFAILEQANRDHTITAGPKVVEKAAPCQSQCRWKEGYRPDSFNPRRSFRPPALSRRSRRRRSPTPRRRTPRRQQKPPQQKAFRRQQHPHLQNQKGAGRARPRR